jgi:hypothetical protein
VDRLKAMRVLAKVVESSVPTSEMACVGEGKEIHVSLRSGLIVGDQEA